ncbi:ATP-binding protein [Nitrosospira sp. Is2]|uniref:ATP-binding protein n=1 Tax=Nitrosospira sp. Is2 TaxID=3080532 RepID=UPI002953D8B7|nr:ATP-binding protein [Nitrosospira sp. Is2]WON73541.1 ATP-binding protein [Nitrosospira sp. Is2]
MDIAENDSDEVRRLRRTMQDLVAFSTLPAAWGLGPDGIAKSLAKVLLSTLDLDLVYIRLPQPDGSGFTETVRSKHRPDADHCITEAKAPLASFLTSVALAPVTAVRDPFGPGTLRTTVTPFDLVEEHGVLVSGSQRVNFPTEQERLLLGLAANQATMVLQRQRAEQALQQSEERFRDFANAAPAKLWVTEPDGSCSFLSQGWYEFTGQGEDEGLGLGWLNAVHPDDREAAGKHFLSANERNEAFSIEYRLRRADGVYRWIIDRGRPRFSPSGQFLGYAGNLLDITERKQSEEQMATLLAAEKQRATLLAQVANASKSINVMLSMESIARTLTEEARSMLGAHQAVTSLTVSENWAQGITAVSLSDKYADYRAYSEKPVGSGIYIEVCRTNCPMRMTQKELEAHPAWKGFGKHAKDHPPMRGWLAVPLIGHGGKNLGLVQLTDKAQGEFTEEDEAILVQLAAIASVGIENAYLYEQVREQDQRKDEFLATLAHELRNPLAPIRTGLAVLKLASSIDATVKTREIMERQVEHMVRLIDDLLDVSRITSGKIQLKKERVDVRTVLNTALELSRPLIEESRHELLVSTPEETLLLDVDPVRMAQVVSNLLNNAAKYTPEGGRVELSAERDGNEVIIRVRDNGVGLAPETLPKVFKLFSQVGKTLDRSRGGLGIGLALVKRLVEMHNGHVTAESQGSGKGSAFVVRLPLATTQKIGGRLVAGEHCARSLSIPRRILVVDDNVDGAQTLAMLLMLSGHTVETAHTGPDALKTAHAFQPSVMILDIGLPGMSGYEVAEQLRSDSIMNGLILIALTGWGSEDDRRRAQNIGFNHHLTKPVKIEKLHSLLIEIDANNK